MSLISESRLYSHDDQGWNKGGVEMKNYIIFPFIHKPRVTFGPQIYANLFTSLFTAGLLVRKDHLNFQS